MNVLSLFSGIGGLELGLERAGMTVVGQVEIDPFCRRVLAKHWPEVPRHDDVRTCVEWWLGDTRPTVDLVCGGFPCQPVSSAGQRLAQEDPRWLWPAFNDIVRQLRPRYVLVENVPGLLARGMGDVLGDLADLGYDAEWDRVPAAFVGAPHIRGRIFVVAYANSQQHESGALENGGAATENISSNAYCDQLRQESITEFRRGDPTVTGNNGAAQYVADTHGATRGIPAAVFTRTRSAPLPRTASTRSGRRGSTDSWWAAEPDVGRVAHGIPARMDRLRALGNAVVPQVAEHVGRLILAADAERGAAA